jgi:hypothetical protein
MEYHLLNIKYIATFRRFGSTEGQGMSTSVSPCEDSNIIAIKKWTTNKFIACSFKKAQLHKEYQKTLFSSREKVV